MSLHTNVTTPDEHDLPEAPARIRQQALLELNAEKERILQARLDLLNETPEEEGSDGESGGEASLLDVLPNEPSGDPLT